MPGTTDITLKWVQSLDEALEFKRWLGERRPVLAVDTETSGLQWHRDRLRTVQFGDRHTGWCIEWNMWAGLVIEAIRDYEGPIVMHNAKFDTHFLELNGVPLKRWLVHDSRAMAHIVNPAIPSGLKPRAARVLGPWAMHGQDELKTAMVKGGWGWGDIPVDLLWQYAAFDTVLTAQLAEELMPEVQKKYAGIYGLELAATQVLADMERRGLLTDRKYLAWAHEEWSREMVGVAHAVREEFQIQSAASDKQVVTRLMSMGWQPVVFTEKGAIKLDNEVLDGIVESASGVAGTARPLPPEAGRLAELVKRHREYHKLVGTYVENLLELADSHGRLHADINPLGARTGRMSVSRPSLQNLPSKDARIRNAFISGPGQTLVLADFDQIEMRIFAHYSGSQPMIDAVKYGDWMTEQGQEGYDFHSMSARMVFNIPMDQPVPKWARKKVKTVGFGKVYGAGATQLAAIMGTTPGEAQETINVYERTFPETAKNGFGSRIAEALVKRDRMEHDPYVLTAYGRKEPCWPSEAYKAVNYLIQGTAADVMKDRMIAVSRTWLGDHMLLPIHDELVLEVPDDAVGDAIATLREVMPERERFAVPLTVDAVATKRWGSKYEEQ